MNFVAVFWLNYFKILILEVFVLKILLYNVPNSIWESLESDALNPSGILNVYPPISSLAAETKPMLATATTKNKQKTNIFFIISPKMFKCIYLIIFIFITQEYSK